MGTIIGAILIAFAPLYWLIILGGALVAAAAALIIMLVPITLAGPSAPRDIALANGASSVASIAAPILYGVVASIPGAQGRWAALIMVLPAIFVLIKIEPIDFVETPSAYAERWAGRKAQRRRRKDLSDAFGPVASVTAFGGPTHVKDSQRARATMPPAGASIHISDLTQRAEDPRPEGIVAAQEAHLLAQPDLDARPRDRTKQAVRHASKIAVALGMLRIALAMVPEFSLATWGAARLTQLGITPANAASLAAAFPVGLAVGRLSAALVIKRQHVFQISLALSGIGTVLVGLAPSGIIATVGMAICGVGTALLYPLTIDDMTKIPGLPTRRAAALATISGGLAVFAAPLCLGFVAQHLSIGLSLIALLPATVLLLFIPASLLTHRH